LDKAKEYLIEDIYSLNILLLNGANASNSSEEEAHGGRSREE
jgi:hypothetical protein